MAKSKGGVGFRDLHGFNLALLGKHVWNFVNNPQSLVARIYKARYFPNDHVFHARRGGGDSFIWSGIWQAKENLKDGFRWVLGNGEDIHAFSDPWLRLKEGFQVDQTHENNNREDKVSDFFLAGTKRWDEVKIRETFNQTDAQLILSTRIPQNNIRDRVAWSKSTNGCYSVKTGYKHWKDCFADCFRPPSSTGWNKLWRVGLPHKIRMFLWRFCRNNVPVRKLLRGKGVNVTMLRYRVLSVGMWNMSGMSSWSVSLRLNVGVT